MTWAEKRVLCHHVQSGYPKSGTHQWGSNRCMNMLVILLDKTHILFTLYTLCTRESQFWPIIPTSAPNTSTCRPRKRSQRPRSRGTVTPRSVPRDTPRHTQDEHIRPDVRNCWLWTCSGGDLVLFLLTCGLLAQPRRSLPNGGPLALGLILTLAGVRLERAVVGCGLHCRT